MKRFLFLFSGLIATHALRAAAPIQVKPAVLSPDAAPGLVAAVRLQSAMKRERELGRPDRFLSADYDVKSTLSTRPSYNPEKTSADLRAGIDFGFDRPQEAEPFPGGDAVQNTDVSVQRDRTWQWGTLSCQLAGGFEADEPFRNRQWTYGGRLNYTPSALGSRIQTFLPFLALDYRRVAEEGNVVARRAGIGDQEYWRFGSQVYWQFALSQWTSEPFVRHLKVIPGFQYFKNTDYALERLGGDWADAFYAQCSVEYTIPEATWLGRYASHVTLGWAKGRVPPTLREQTTFSVSATLRWDQFIR